MSPRTNLLTAALVIAAVLSAGPGAAQVSLVRDGEARAVVVLPDEPADVARYAAEELVWHVP